MLFRSAFDRRDAPVNSPHWAAEPGGCRVVTQSKRDYVLGKQTPAWQMLFAMLRLRRLAPIRLLPLALRVDGRRWRQLGVWRTALANAAVRRAWRRGVPAAVLARQYYGTTP